MNKDINKQLQTVIGNLIGKDYFKLEFGQKVIMKHNVDGDYDVICSNSWGDNPSFGLSLRGFQQFYRDDVIEILGQEPTLNDVLLAMFKKGKSCNVSQLGEIFEIRNGERYYGKIYDLKESLFSQSEETKLAIIKLLE